ncbi:hypothetical protein DFH06DRAFT_1130951 [Mycena polygramma]|nr:hypothetical protein DFH06DRAFT_1130951 [Mycena polygramma]
MPRTRWSKIQAMWNKPPAVDRGEARTGARQVRRLAGGHWAHAALITGSAVQVAICSEPHTILMREATRNVRREAQDAQRDATHKTNSRKFKDGERRGPVVMTDWVQPVVNLNWDQPVVTTDRVQPVVNPNWDRPVVKPDWEQPTAILGNKPVNLFTGTD